MENFLQVHPATKKLSTTRCFDLLNGWYFSEIIIRGRMSLVSDFISRTIILWDKLTKNKWLNPFPFEHFNFTIVTSSTTNHITWSRFNCEIHLTLAMTKTFSNINHFIFRQRSFVDWMNSPVTKELFKSLNDSIKTKISGCLVKFNVLQFVIYNANYIVNYNL